MATIPQLGLMVVQTISWVFINSIWRPKFNHVVLTKNGSGLCVWPTWRLTGSLISMVCWARLGGQQWARVAGGQRGERSWLRGSRLGSLCGSLWPPVHGAALRRTLWRVVLGDIKRSWETLRNVLLYVLGNLLGRALKVTLRSTPSFLRRLLLPFLDVLLVFTLQVCILHMC